MNDRFYEDNFIGSAQLGLKVLKKRFFSYEKRFFMRKKLTPWRVEVICVNLVVFRPVDFHGGFYLFSLRLLRPFWKILSARLLFANVFWGALRSPDAGAGNRKVDWFFHFCLFLFFFVFFCFFLFIFVYFCLFLFFCLFYV